MADYTTERVFLPKSSCSHLVTFNEKGECIEVRAEIGRRRFNGAGPVEVPGHRDVGRRTWHCSEGEMTITAACACRAALRQRRERMEKEQAA